MKNFVVATAVILIIISCAVIYNASQSMGGIQEELAKERYLRMSAEEKLQKYEFRLRSLQSEIEESNRKFEKIETILKSGKIANANLKSQLNDISEAKQELESKMKQWQDKGAIPPLQDSTGEY